MAQLKDAVLAVLDPVEDAEIIEAIKQKAKVKALRSNVACELTITQPDGSIHKHGSD